MDGNTDQSTGEQQTTLSLKDKVVEALRTVYDPEIPVNIYDLGLVYGIDIDLSSNVIIRMTLTSPMCPMAMSIPADVEYRVLAIPGVISARVDLVWDPPWNPDKMSEAARLKLGLL